MRRYSFTPRATTGMDILQLRRAQELREAADTRYMIYAGGVLKLTLIYLYFVVLPRKFP